jgi:hypothetical protein
LREPSWERSIAAIVGIVVVVVVKKERRDAVALYYSKTTGPSHCSNQWRHGFGP